MKINLNIGDKLWYRFNKEIKFVTIIDRSHFYYITDNKNYKTIYKSSLKPNKNLRQIQFFDSKEKAIYFYKHLDFCKRLDKMINRRIYYEKMSINHLKKIVNILKLYTNE